MWSKVGVCTLRENAALSSLVIAGSEDSIVFVRWVRVPYAEWYVTHCDLV